MDTSDARLEKLRERMKKEGVDLVALGPGPHMHWLLGLHPHADERPCLACVSGDNAALLMPALNAEAAKEETDIPMAVWSDAEGPDAAFRQVLSMLVAEQARKIVLDETMRADFAALVADALPKAQREFTASTVGYLRMRKDEAEYSLLAKNARMADAAMRAAWAAIEPGVSELEVADVIRAEFRGQGAEPLFSIVGAGRNGAFPHHRTGPTTLKQGDAVVIDLGGGFGGYSSDITRMAVIGEPPENYGEVHETVETAVRASLAAARPGVLAKEVDMAARNAIADAGYGDYFVHRTGHGLGVEIHEPPYITSASETVLDEGMVFSIEPGIYLPGRFGVRLEEIVILHADGPEILSGLPRDAAEL